MYLRTHGVLSPGWLGTTPSKHRQRLRMQQAGTKSLLQVWPGPRVVQQS